MKPFADLLFRLRIPFAALILIVTVLLALPIRNLSLDNTLGAWFSGDNRHLLTYREFQDEFSGNRNLFIVVEADDVFTPGMLDYLRRKTEEIGRLALVDEVHSLASAIRVEGDSDGLTVGPLLEKGSDPQAEEIRAYALGNDLLRGGLVSADGSAAALVVTFDEDRADEHRMELLTTIRAIMNEGLKGGARLHYTGSMETSKEYDRFTLQNQRDFMLPLILMISVSILLLFRSFFLLIIIGTVVAASLTWTAGIFTLMGYSVNVISGMLTPLVGFLSISDSIHILEYHDEVRRTTEDRRSLFTKTVSYITFPCLATTLTTSFGLLSLTTSQVPAVRTFGLGAAIGILSAFVISIGIVPFALSALPVRSRSPRRSPWIGSLERLHRLNTRRPALIFTAMTMVTMLSTFFITRLEVETNQLEFFEEGSPFRQSSELVDEKLSGFYSVEIFLKGETGVLKEPRVLRRMESLSGRLSGLPHVKKVSSVVDRVKLINRELSGGGENAHRIPGRKDLVAQELFLFSMSREGREALSGMVSSDFSRGRISVRMESASSDELVKLCHEVEEAADRAFAGTGVTPLVTGVGQLFSELDRYLVRSQIRSFTMAFVTVIIFMFVSFRSWKYGVLSILPNLFPILLILGIMGASGITLNVATVMVSGVALGVAADDTIHFIWRLRKERSGNGTSIRQAVGGATVNAGRAIVSTSSINIAGFSVLVLADFIPTVYFGFLTALTLVLALIGDLVYLPALLLTVRRTGTGT